MESKPASYKMADSRKRNGGLINGDAAEPLNGEWRMMSALTAGFDGGVNDGVELRKKSLSRPPLKGRREHALADILRVVDAIDK